MTVVVVTVVHGRAEHLARQVAGLARSTLRPDRHVVVAMDDPAVADAPDGGLERLVVPIDRRDGRLPLAAARNAGVRAAWDGGAEVAVLLDVDCIPAPGLVEAYARAAADAETSGDLLGGPVTYLPPPPAGGYDLDALPALDAPHPARPAPAPGAVVRSDDQHDLFWSLSFALRQRTWHDLGGFDEAYLGYGGEDTDFACRARRAGVSLAWIGSARAYHQHHPVSSPPVEHLEDVVRNAALFHARWGTWPMRGWLDAFERDGLVARRDDGSYVVREPAALAELAAGGTLGPWL